MRRFILLFIVAFMAMSCGTKEDAVLVFNVNGPTAREVVVVCHNDIIQAPLDENGRAEVVMAGIDAAYVKVFYGREFRWIYFEKGDKASMSFDGNDFAGTFTFEGDKTKAVEYLHKVKLTALPDVEYSLPFDQYREKIRSKEEAAIKLMKANGLSSAGKFVKMEEGRIRYSYAAQLLMYPVGHKLMAMAMAYTPDEEYYKMIEEYFVENEAWADIDEYRNFVAEAAHVLDAENRDVSAIYPKTVAQMRYIADRFSTAKVRDILLHSLAATYVDRYGIDDIQDLENIYHSYVKDEALLADYASKFDKWDVSKPGKPSPALSATDIDGKVWTLEDFRGRYVYIDMWATWCAPCRREVPYLKALAEKFQDAHIVFLGLSVDSDKAKWEDMVRGGSLSGVQLYLGSQSAFQKAYNVEGIPHFILLDKEGRIISNDMSKPSADQTAAVLEALEGIR